MTPHDHLVILGYRVVQRSDCLVVSRPGEVLVGRDGTKAWSLHVVSEAALSAAAAWLGEEGELWTQDES